MNNTEIKQIVMDIAEILDEKKAEDIVILDFDGKNDFTDYMVICEAESFTQIKALSKYVDGMMRDKGIKPHSQFDDRGNNSWILLDYISVVVHIFQKEARQFYNLEKLWSEAIRIEYPQSKSTAV